MRKVIWNNIMFAKNWNSKIINLHGRDKLREVQIFEKTRILIAKRKTHLAFLKRCRGSYIIPTFAIINHSLKNHKNKHIFNRASMALLCNEIKWTRGELDSVSQKAFHLHTTLANQIDSKLWTEIDATLVLKALRTKESTCKKQS